ncbi:hypothetical protein Anapl_01569 [Anas platyrhynchos]|uniref:Uncharacterized protein n=1 Tax=Anas platyrhynchos TaxID=8839 RepID=R0JX38_ANAPL|nr:hypothetical protein Anapl_01569 [Anas platyrhynchos]
MVVELCGADRTERRLSQTVILTPALVLQMLHPSNDPKQPQAPRDGEGLFCKELQAMLFPTESPLESRNAQRSQLLLIPQHTQVFSSVGHVEPSPCSPREILALIGAVLPSVGHVEPSPYSPGEILALIGVRTPLGL